MGSRRSGLLGMAALGIAIATTLAGCSDGTPGSDRTPVMASSPSPAAKMSADQKAALSDKRVSYDEYLDGWNRYVACEADAGYTVTKTDETNQVIMGQVPDGAVRSGVDARCYDAEFAQIDTIWQVSREDTSPQANAFRECLEAHDVKPAKTERKMIEQLESNGIDRDACRDRYMP
ncbi:hypothetical protein DEI97_003625 [Curtobacterium sp. MCLR17_032]|uniref:hypothetical protein n=1 Tax=Curtobacterium sp. MCLR17_032 TaxID=2175650 RepID=UPI0011B5F034|nr:hypothetical protein [Curtobacterium sp. MCLR17_032]WIE62246.1 hypothetical protein DEI97_003625 [Curtobacterium sp. MCLR17_032]